MQLYLYLVKHTSFLLEKLVDITLGFGGTCPPAGRVLLSRNGKKGLPFYTETSTNWHVFFGVCARGRSKGRISYSSFLAIYFSYGTQILVESFNFLLFIFLFSQTRLRFVWPQHQARRFRSVACVTPC